MISASNRLKQLIISQWKLLFISPIHPSFDSVRSLKLSVPLFLHTNSTPIKHSWICSTLSTFTFKTRSLVTRASTTDEEVACQVLDEIVSELPKSPSSIKELCTNHVNLLCKERNLRAAAKLLQLLRDKHSINSLPAYNLLLVAAAENNDTEISLRVFKDLLVNHLPLNSTTYFNVAKAISKSNDFTMVPSFLKKISELINTESVTVINRIIYAFADCGHDHNAMLVFDNLKSFKLKPDLVTYNTILGILGKAGRVDEMLNLFASMKKDDIAPDIYSYNTLLHSLRKVGRFDLCLVLTKEMGKVGLQPDLITYTAVIECLFKSGNIEESLALFEDMKRGNIRPSIYIYRSLVNNLKKLGKCELAVKFVEEMNECRDDLIGPKDIKKKKR